jgi:hypothetical protein
MGLQSPPFASNPDTFTDWLELSACLHPAGRIYLVDIERAWEAQRQAQDSDYEGGELEFDNWLRPIIGCIERRAKALGEAYPFELDDNADMLGYLAKLSDDHVGHVVYLLCLVISALPDSEVMQTPTLVLDNKIRDQFQSCAAWAAAGFVGGSCHVLGWPRPERDPFIKALEHIYHVSMADGEAEVRKGRVPGASSAEKDAGIDIIAWKPRLDRMAGKIYLLGQVASGQNWRDKPVAPDVKSLHDNWFNFYPVSHAIPAIFIPYSVSAVSGSTLQEQMRFLVPKFGAIFYRDVLARYAQIGFRLGKEGTAQVHRMEDLTAVRTYVETAFKQLGGP